RSHDIWKWKFPARSPVNIEQETSVIASAISRARASCWDMNRRSTSMKASLSWSAGCVSRPPRTEPKAWSPSYKHLDSLREHDRSAMKTWWRGLKRMARQDENRSVLIFGGAGFIGANLARRLLLETCARVHIFDNLSRRGVQHNL